MPRTCLSSLLRTPAAVRWPSGARYRAKSKEVDDLVAVIGDPETVCDDGSWLTAARVTLSGSSPSAACKYGPCGPSRRRPDVLKTLERQVERAELRESLRRDQARLAYWEQMAPLHADMCCECDKPALHTPGTI